jgi:hypothetical protein
MTRRAFFRSALLAGTAAVVDPGGNGHARRWDVRADAPPLPAGLLCRMVLRAAWR